ncbi:unnamed protein product, partial [Rotaria sordida]
MDLWNDYEQKLIQLIHDVNRKDDLSDVLTQQSIMLQTARKRIVLAFLGSLKSTKSSLINFLLNDDICPTGNEAATARLTKITYGQQIRLIRKMNNGTESKTIDFLDTKQLLIKATEYIKLPAHERSIECKDEIIIELPNEALKNVELWDIPGFDENQVIDNRVREIIDDADLIFALISHQDSLKKTFQDFIEPRLKKYRNDFSNHAWDVSTGNDCQVAMICFVVTRIDTFTIDSQTNKTRDEILTNLYRSLETQLNFKFDTPDMQLCNNFIALCTHPRFHLKTFLECRQMFIDKSNQWFKNALVRMAYFRLNYLVGVLQQLLEYGDALRTINRCKELKRAITQCYQEFELQSPSFLSQQLEPIKTDVLTKVPTIARECETLANQEHDQKLEDVIKEKIIEQFSDALRDKQETIRQGIYDLLIKYAPSLELNPAQVQLFEQIMAETDLNPYRLGIGYYENACAFGQQEEALWNLLRQLQWVGVGLFIAGGLLATLNPALVLVAIGGWLLAGGHGFVTRSGFWLTDRIARLFNFGTNDRLEDALRTCVHGVHSVLRQQIVDTVLHFSKQHLKTANTKIDQRINHLSKLSGSQIQTLKQFVEENKPYVGILYLDLLHEQFKFVYRNCEICPERLGASNFEIFAANLEQLNSQKLQVAAKRIPVAHFNVQEVRYLGQLRHLNIVPYYGIFKSQTERDVYYLIMDKMHCDSAAYFRQYADRIDDNQVLKMFSEITHALNYIHRQDLIHRDIKPANILVKTMDDGQPCFYLADFGILHREPETSSGTYHYMAPE